MAEITLSKSGTVKVNGEPAGYVEADDECAHRFFALDLDGEQIEDDRGRYWFDTRHDAAQAVADAYEGI